MFRWNTYFTKRRSISIMKIRYSYYVSFFQMQQRRCFKPQRFCEKVSPKLIASTWNVFSNLCKKDNSSIAIESTTWVLQRSYPREYQLHYQNLSSHVRLSNLRVMERNDVQLKPKIRVNVYQNVSKSNYVLLVAL